MIKFFFPDTDKKRSKKIQILPTSLEIIPKLLITDLNLLQLQSYSNLEMGK